MLRYATRFQTNGANPVFRNCINVAEGLEWVLQPREDNYDRNADDVYGT